MPVYRCQTLVLEGGQSRAWSRSHSCDWKLPSERWTQSSRKKSENTLLEVPWRWKSYLARAYGIGTNQRTRWQCCCFCWCRRVNLAWTDDQRPQYAMSAADLELLKKTDTKRSSYPFINCPIPALHQVVTKRIFRLHLWKKGRRSNYTGERLATSYVNSIL